METNVLQPGDKIRMAYLKPSAEKAERYTVTVDRVNESTFSGPVLQRNGAIRHFRHDRVVSYRIIKSK